MSRARLADRGRRVVSVTVAAAIGRHSEDGRRDRALRFWSERLFIAGDRSATFFVADCICVQTPAARTRKDAGAANDGAVAARAARRRGGVPPSAARTGCTNAILPFTVDAWTRGPLCGSASRRVCSWRDAVKKPHSLHRGNERRSLSGWGRVCRRSHEVRVRPQGDSATLTGFSHDLYHVTG